MRISDWIADVCSADLRAEWRRSDEIPFDARYRYMATRHAAPAGGQTVFVKGAPEQLLAMCAAEATEAGPQPVDHDYWNARIARTASEGERSEEHTSGLQSLMRISYAVFCLKKKNTKN